MLETALFLYYKGKEAKDTESHINQVNLQIQRNYNAFIDSYRSFASSLYKDVIKQDDIIELFKDAHTSDNNKKGEIRAELYKKLQHTFKIINQKNFKIFHFHLPDGSSFLRLHKPWRHGDNLLEFRHSIKEVIKQKHYIEGFEQGRIINSYRFLHPLFYHGEYIGSVETSVALPGMKEELEKTIDAETKILFLDSVIEKEGFTDSTNKYLKSDYYSNFYEYNDSLLSNIIGNDYFNSIYLDKKTLKKLDSGLSKDANALLSDNNAFSLYKKLDNTYYTCTFLPLKNIKGNNAAWIIFYQQDPYYIVQSRTIKKELLLISLVIALFFAMILLLNRSRISLIRKNRELIRSKIKAEQGSKSKSQFLANMSHEIRTPMNGILGMADILHKTKLSKEQNEYLDIIHNSAQNLLTIIDDILDFSKIEADKIELEIIPLSIHETIEGIADILVYKANEKGIFLHTFIDSQIPPFILGDPVRLRQVLLNFANNAIKFTDEGEVLISCELLNKDENEVSLSFDVKDTGIGISKEDQNKLFKTFSQVDASTTRKYGGTGLGLIIAQRLVKLMDGEIIVKSEAGEGSTFGFRARFKIASPTDIKTPDFEKTLRGLKVLIVDDNATNRKIFYRYLQYLDCKVIAVSSPGEGLYHLRQAYQDNLAFDMVLVDFQMPEMDGLDFAHIVKADENLKSNRLLLLSSMTDMLTVNEIRNAGFAGYLNKPVKQIQLFTIMHEIIQQQGSSGLKEQAKQSIADNNKNDISTDITEDTKQEKPKLRLLLVEDNLINQKVAVHTLNRLGHDIDIADNGKIAVDLFLKNEYDIIFMDIQMPVMNGFDATQEIRKIEGQEKRLKKVKIVAITANALKEDKQRCLSAGMDDYIAKPFKPKDLLEIFDD